MRKICVSSVLAVLISAAPAAAGSGLAFIEQVPTTSSLTRSDVSFFRAAETALLANLRSEIGIVGGNAYRVKQEGTGNYSDVTQGGGFGNLADVSQIGSGNTLSVGQNGEMNAFISSQAGSANTVSGTQSGFANYTRVDQRGNGHLVSFNQSGTSNMIVVRQD